MKYLKLKLLLLIVFSMLFSYKATAQVSPQICINEILSSNLSTNPDIVDFDSFSDWIELYNNENSDVNIGGFFLSDDFSLPMKWQIPANTIIPAKGFYLIWADGYNDVPGKTYIRNWWPNNIQFTTKWCHTNFKLNKDGDKIGLFKSDGSIVDSMVFSTQMTDVSFGRQPDGSSEFKYFSEPTPFSANVTSGITSLNISSEVIFSIEGGFYASPIQLTLQSSSGSGIIRFTTDGSIPSTKSQQYVTTIAITSNAVIRARVFEDAKIPGKVFTNSYFIGEAKTLPVISFVADPKFLWDKELGVYLNSYKDREIPVSLEFYSANSARDYFLDAGMKIGGENIFRFAQKPLNIYARSDYGSAHISYKLFDEFPYVEFKQLYLRNGGDDWPNTMLRDGFLETVLKDRISNPMMAFKPSVLYLNGKYWGIHDIREKIDDQYFLLHYRVDPANLDHIDDLNRVITGDSTEFVALNEFASANNLSDSSNYAYVASKIDIHSLMDFVIVQDYLANTSWGHNRELWRDKKDLNLWQWILVDMDRGFNTANISFNQLNDIFTNFGLFRQLCANVNFKNEFVQRYAEHLNHTFVPDRVINKIDSVQAIIQNEIPRHAQKWGTYIDSLTIDIWGKTSGISSLTYWNSEVQKLRNFASQRTPYATQILSNKFGLSGRANLAINANIPNQGMVMINDYLHRFGENNLYFKNIPLPITAYPPPGYGFKQWKEIVLSANLNLIAQGSSWKYSDAGSAPTGLWQSVGYDDAAWKAGNAQLGYGDGDEKTIISYGANTQSKYTTSYYRHVFQVADLAAVKELKLKLLRDDGAVVYLNGNEILRSNMPSGSITYSTFASTAVSGADETTFFEFVLDKNFLVAGSNVLAVEIHQNIGNSSDVSFDLSLDAVLLQQTNTANVISTNQTITYVLQNNTELIAEFEKTSSSELAQSITTPTTLTKTNSPYFALSDITIESTGSLTVEPGTIIYFAAGKGITVKGTMLMNGTLAEPITLTSYFPSEKWGAICFDNSIGISELTNVNISLATNGSDPVNFFAAVSSLNSSVQLTNVHFTNVKLPISAQWSNLTVNSCFFENVTEVGDYINCNGGNLSIFNSVFNGNAVSDMDAIDLGFMAGTTDIHHNIIRDFTGSNSDGIDLGDASQNVVLSDNVISNCSDKGVSVGQGTNVMIVHNVISNCNLGVGVKDSLSSADIFNTTFYKNNIGVSCFEKVLHRGGGTAEIRNSIIANSKLSSISFDEFSKMVVSYSISNTDTLFGKNNIFGEPLLINPDGQNFYPQTNSPCINAGDPQLPFDDDGSISDLGAKAYSGAAKPEIVINEINYNSSISYDSGDWIELFNAAPGAVDLSNWVFMDENRIPSFVFPEGTILSAGAYLTICGDVTLFAKIFPNSKNYLGSMSSGLSGSGEALYLYNNLGQLVDSLTYDDKNPWPTGADGGGSSLELLNPAFENALGVNWKASIGSGTPGAINSTYVTDIKDKNNSSLPTEFSLSQNYPNPFNPATTIAFGLPKESEVVVTLYNMLGEVVLKNEFGSKAPGYHELLLDLSGKTSGVYFYAIQAMPLDGSKNFREVKKLILLK